MMKIIFRTHASSTVGYGHLIRCTALAMNLKEKGASNILICSELNDLVKPDVFDQWIPLSHWGSEKDDALQLVAFSKQFHCNIAVLDDYRIDADYQKVLHHAAIKWLQFDDLGTKPLWADWIVNAAPSACESHYKPLLIKENACVLTGTKYAVMRPEFAKLSHFQRQAKGNFKILVTFGGGDDRGAILFVLKLLYEAIKDASFVVVSGPANPRNTDISQWISKKNDPRLVLHINPTELSNIFLSCDLAVMSGGTMTYEAAACGVPMLIMAIADNQIKQAKAWEMNGAAHYMGKYGNISPESLIEKVNILKSDTKRLKKMSTTGISMIDGKGADRIARKLIKNE